MNRRTNNEELLRHYQTEAQDIRSRRQQDKTNRINEEKQYIKQMNNELEQESQIRFQNKLNSMNAQREDYQRFLTEKNTRQKSGDFRKKTSDIQGTFKIGGDNREIRLKHRENYGNEITQNINTINQIPKAPVNYNTENNYSNNLTTKANIAKQNRNKSLGFNIINHQTDINSNNINRVNNYNSNYNAYAETSQPEIPKLQHNIQIKANKASYNPVNHTENNNYNSQYASNNSRVSSAKTNDKYNPINHNAYNSNNNKNNQNVNYGEDINKNRNMELINKPEPNLKYEDEYERIVRENDQHNVEPNYRLESEGNIKEDFEERYNKMTDEEKRKLYEEYMRNHALQNSNEEEVYNEKVEKPKNAYYEEDFERREVFILIL